MSHLFRAGAALLVLAYLWKTSVHPGAPARGHPLIGIGTDAVRGRIIDDGRGLRVLLACGAGFVLPLLAWGLVYAWFGAVRTMVDWLVVLPQRLSWFVPFPSVYGRAVIMAAVVSAGGWVLIGHRRHRIGAAVAWILALAVLGVSAALTSGFRYNLLDVYLPVAIVVAAAPLSLRQGAGDAARLLWCFGSFMLLSLYPAADIVHALLMLPAVLPLLALVLEYAWGVATTAAARALVLALAAGPILPPAVAGVTLLAQTIATLHPGRTGFARATGIRDEGPTLTACAAAWPRSSASRGRVPRSSSCRTPSSPTSWPTEHRYSRPTRCCSTWSASA